MVTDGYNGFQYENYEYFKMHLTYILEKEERRAQMAENARETAYLFSTWNFCTMAENLYREVLARQETEETVYAGRAMLWQEFSASMLRNSRFLKRTILRKGA